jgi:hypothetical protein
MGGDQIMGEPARYVARELARDIRQTRAIQWIVPRDSRAPTQETSSGFDFF